MFTIGFKNSKYDFDILDNPYVAVQAGKSVTDWILSENKDISLRKCNDEEGYKADGIWYQGFKGNLLCLDDPGNLKIKANWHEPEFESLVVECMNSTTRLCKSPEDIEDFIRHFQIFLFKSNTFVNDGIYKHNTEFISSDGQYFPIEIE